MELNEGIEKILDNIHNDEDQFIEKVVEQMNINPFDITPAHYNKISILVMEHEVRIINILKESHQKINEERERAKLDLTVLLKPYVNKN